MSHVLITGANRGIGLALTKIYAQRGDTVLACCRAPDQARELQSLAKTHAVQVLPLAVDNEASVAALAKELSSTAIDTLINNAGIIGQPGERQTATTMDFSMWAEILNINTMGPVRVMQALLPQLKRSKHTHGLAHGLAKVMNVTSDLGALSHDDPIYYGYSASKAALNKFMRLAALELKRDGIAIGLIHPGWVQTDMGGSGAAISPVASATGIVKVIDQLTLANAGSFWQWDGSLRTW
jgi:NAD(P)-dependent dehydrogenase (short-subunit alcohol dehydrogenase family)